MDQMPCNTQLTQQYWWLESNQLWLLDKQAAVPLYTTPICMQLNDIANAIYVGLYSWIALNTLGCYAMLCSLRAEKLVQESDQCGQVTKVEMKCLLWISWLFKPYGHCSFIEYHLYQNWVRIPHSQLPCRLDAVAKRRSKVSSHPAQQLAVNMSCKRS